MVVLCSGGKILEVLCGDCLVMIPWYEGGGNRMGLWFIMVIWWEVDLQWFYGGKLVGNGIKVASWLAISL